jgi:hypothetical protein
MHLLAVGGSFLAATTYLHPSLHVDMKEICTYKAALNMCELYVDLQAFDICVTQLDIL